VVTDPSQTKVVNLNNVRPAARRHFRIAIQILKCKIYRTMILPVVLYGCETWSLTLREERRLRVSEEHI
jgi:hypothetical protein